ncbi:MAG: polysaccharide deacetylase family protein [Gammaproteobacteria bacterium]|jgi:peptidoglycan/xylan/chitin deacetylase (PgdA/CDA1 family)|nr:polysaccharide deacetylase family protein [Gammaproteobacteria bacterium]MBQ0775841.1 polysaccharide deacetylase family protein [Gammaproteobacteria bacterium]
MNRVVLMYHAIVGDSHHLDSIPQEDHPYAVDTTRLADHLALFSDYKVLITFDDGDAGWYLEALPILEKFSVKALFFVTPRLIGTPGYCDWEGLSALSAAGHEIGAHGLTHQFLPDLDEVTCRNELVESKSIIERRLNTKVRSMSFPGGRYGRRELRLAQAAGYEVCYTSVPGRVQGNEFCRPRVAVRADSSVLWLARVVSGDRPLWVKMKLSYLIKRIVKSVLGNRGYHELYRFFRG